MNKMANFRWYEPRKPVVGGYAPLEKNIGTGLWFLLELIYCSSSPVVPIYFI
jgi:hypothetical protein